MMMLLIVTIIIIMIITIIVSITFFTIESDWFVTVSNLLLMFPASRGLSRGETSASRELLMLLHIIIVTSKLLDLTCPTTRSM